MIKYYSTTALAKRLGLEPKTLFAKLVEVNFMVRGQKDTGDKWLLTAKGKLAGGKIKTSVKLGNYIEWPEDFDLGKLPEHQTPNKPIETTTTTKLANNFNLPPNKFNHILAELGWLNKSVKGWVTTDQGIKQGAVQKEDSRTGIPYVKWPANIIESSLLLNSIESVTGRCNPSSISFKKGYHTLDGHFVESIAEMIIDNWLYLAEIPHAYRRKLPITEDTYCDFYLPSGKVYIEYWPNVLDLKQQAQKDKKLAVYQKYGLDLIELNHDDVNHLDEILPRFLLKFGLQAY